MFGLFSRGKSHVPNEAMKAYCQQYAIDLSQIEKDISSPVLSLTPGLEKSILCCVFIRFKRMAKEKKGAAFQSSRYGASAGQDMLDALSALQQTLNEAAFEHQALDTQILSRIDGLMQRYETEVFDENGFGYGTLVSFKRDFSLLISNERSSHE